MNNLFAVKLLTIMCMLEESEKWSKTLNVFSEQLKTPDDGLNRHILCSPTVQHLFKKRGYEFNRYRLVLPDTFFNMRMSDVKIEVYSKDGDLQEEIFYEDWDFELSMAVEVELLEILLNINPY